MVRSAAYAVLSQLPGPFVEHAFQLVVPLLCKAFLPVGGVLVDCPQAVDHLVEVVDEQIGADELVLLDLECLRVVERQAERAAGLFQSRQPTLGVSNAPAVHGVSGREAFGVATLNPPGRDDGLGQDVPSWELIAAR